MMKTIAVGFKPHFVCSILMFVFISMMVFQNSQISRVWLLVPITSLFLAFQVLYSMEIVSVQDKKRKELQTNEKTN